MQRLREGEIEAEGHTEEKRVPVPKGEGLRDTLPLPEREGQGEAVALRVALLLAVMLAVGLRESEPLGVLLID